jgi:hypothetical protein
MTDVTILQLPAASAISATDVFPVVQGTVTAQITAALASVAVVNKALVMTYDSTTAKWYPSY